MPKRIFSMFMCAVLSISLLAGCGGSGSASTDAQASPASQSGSNEAAAPSAAENTIASRTMRFLHWRTEDKAAFEKLARDFEEKNPGLAIEIEIIPTQDYAKTLIMRLQGGEVADVFAVSPDGDFITTYKTGRLLELNGCEGILSNFDEDGLASGTRDGITYAVPQTTNALAIYYNKDIFAEYNLNVPATVEEFMTVCQTLKDNGITPMAQGAGEIWMPEFFIENLIANCMDDPTVFANGKIMDDPGIVDVIKVAKDIYDAGYILEGSSGIKEESLLTGFAVGNYAMIATGTWSMATVRTISDEIDFGLFNMPGTKGTLKGVSNTGLQLAIAKDSALLEDAKGFVEYLTSPDALTYFCNETGQLAVAKGVQIESDDLAMAQSLLTDKDGFISAPFHQPNAEGLDICWVRSVALVTEPTNDPQAFAEAWQAELLATMK